MCSHPSELRGSWGATKGCFCHVEVALTVPVKQAPPDICLHPIICIRGSER